MPINTPWVGSGLTAIYGVSGASFGGTVIVGSPTSQAPVVNLVAQGAHFLSRATTASATSLILADGEFAVMFASATSARLCFRSGSTTYTWIATTGAVL